MLLRWSQRASADFDEFFSYVAADSEAAAARQARLVLAATRRLESFPQSGRRVRVTQSRELVVPGTPYIIRYRLESNFVILISIKHGAQHPSKRR